jgi:glutamyl-tRNA reductase
MRVRKHRPMFFIDMAVPRDIDPAIQTLENGPACASAQKPTVWR